MRVLYLCLTLLHYLGFFGYLVASLQISQLQGQLKLVFRVTGHSQCLRFKALNKR